MKPALSQALALADAQAQLLAMTGPLPAEDVPVSRTLGRYLTRSLVARRTHPPADLSAMDGYALGDCTAGPWQVIGESAAGHPFGGRITATQAVRISTGAVLPDGAMTVLLQEDAARDGDALHLAGESPSPGRHIRRAGFDFTQGDALRQVGERIDAAAIALAIAAGHATLPVCRPPSIVVIDSGDELAADPTQCAPHQIPASNGPMLEAMLAALPCTVRRIGPVPDDHAALAAALRDAEGADLVVTSGGASVGDHDLIRPALEEWGADIAFWRVAMKPGKPLMVARRGGQFVLGLPGNPVSSFVTALLFLLPLVRALLGARFPLPKRFHAPLGTEMKPGGIRLEFVRARWDGKRLVPLAEQDSSGLSALASANALIERPPNAPAAAVGTLVPFILLENGAIA